MVWHNLPNAVLLGLVIWHFLLKRFWPYNWKGMRKEIVLKKRKDEWRS